MSYNAPPPQQPGQPQWGQQPPQPGWGAGGPPQPKKNNAGKVIGFGCGGLVLLLLIVGVLGAFLTSGTDTDDDADRILEVTASPSTPGKGKTAPAPKGAEGDVTIKSCEVNSTTTWPAADLEIVNHSDAKANYIVSIEFVDAAGVRLGEGMAATNSLAPGQKAKAKAQSLSDTSGKVTCKVAKVTRYPAG
jgi:hypothetical protein